MGMAGMGMMPGMGGMPGMSGMNPYGMDEELPFQLVMPDATPAKPHVVCSDGSVVKVKVRSGEEGPRGRRPDIGDECVVRWTERAWTGEKARPPPPEKMDGDFSDSDDGEEGKKAAPTEEEKKKALEDDDEELYEADEAAYVASGGAKARAIVLGDVDDPTVPAGLHDAVVTMIRGEKCRLVLDGGKQTPRELGKTSCFCELVAVMPVEDCARWKDRTILKKCFIPSGEWSKPKLLDEVKLQLRANVPWKIGDPGAKRSNAPDVETEYFHGTLGDLRPAELQEAVVKMALKEEALVRVGDEKTNVWKTWAIVVESIVAVADCSGDAGDGSVLKKEIAEGSGWDHPGEECDVSCSVFAGVWLSAAGRALGPVEGLRPAIAPLPEVGEGEALPAPDMVPSTTLDAPVRAALRQMKKGETGHATADALAFGPDSGVNVPAEAGAVAKLKLVCHTWRDNEKLTECGNVLKKVMEKGNEEDATRAKALDQVAVEFTTLALEVPREDGAPASDEREWSSVEGFAPFVLDWTIDETDAVCKGLEEGAKAMGLGERAELTVVRGGDMGYAADFAENAAGTEDKRFAPCGDRTFKTTMVLKKLDVVSPSYELDAIPKLARAVDYKGRGNACFAGGGNIPRAIRRYGAAIDCVSSTSETNLDAAQLADKHALNVVLLSNRAAAYLADKDYAKGRADCDKALETDKKNVKALYRRAQCCFHLDDWFEAKHSYKKCLAIDPACKEATRGLARIAQRAKAQDAKDKEKFAGHRIAQAIQCPEKPVAKAADEEEAPPADGDKAEEEDGPEKRTWAASLASKPALLVTACLVVAAVGGCGVAWYLLTSGK